MLFISHLAKNQYSISQAHTVTCRLARPKYFYLCGSLLLHQGLHKGDMLTIQTIWPIHALGFQEKNLVHRPTKTSQMRLPPERVSREQSALRPASAQLQSSEPLLETRPGSLPHCTLLTLVTAHTSSRNGPSMGSRKDKSLPLTGRLQAISESYGPGQGQDLA